MAFSGAVAPKGSWGKQDPETGYSHQPANLWGSALGDNYVTAGYGHAHGISGASGGRYQTLSQLSVNLGSSSRTKPAPVAPTFWAGMPCYKCGKKIYNPKYINDCYF